METDAAYFFVQQGMLFSRHYYLPAHLLVGSDADRAFLAVTLDEAKALAREELPPARDAWYDIEEGGATVPPIEGRETPSVSEPASALVEEPVEQPVIAPAVAG